MVTSLPSDVLDYPYPSEPIPPEINEVLQVGDWLSPSHVLLKGIELVFGFNPGEEVATWLAGDWHGMGVGAAALGQLSEYAQAVARDLDTSATHLLEHWSGNAASEAHGYFERLTQAIDALRAPLDGLATEYNTLAVGMIETASAIGSVLEALLDKLIEMGVKALAATATSETVVGGLFFGAWAAYDAYKAEKLWMKAVEYHGYAVTASNAFVGVTAGYLGAINSPDDFPLPAGSYHHPGVAR